MLGKGKQQRLSKMSDSPDLTPELHLKVIPTSDCWQQKHGYHKIRRRNPDCRHDKWREKPWDGVAALIQHCCGPTRDCQGHVDVEDYLAKRTLRQRQR